MYRRGVLVPLLLGGLLASGCSDDGSTAAAPSSATPTADATPNGVERRSPQEILSRAQKAMQTAAPMRMRGEATGEGDTVGLDLRFAGTSRTTGEITISGHRISLVRVDEALYVKGDDAFWRTRGGQPVVTMMSGKYLKASADDLIMAFLAAVSDTDAMLKSTLTPGGTVTKQAPATINGQAAIAVRDSENGTTHIATRGRPLVLRVAGGNTADGGWLEFTDYGVPVTISAPPANQVVDVTRFRKVAGEEAAARPIGV